MNFERPTGFLQKLFVMRPAICLLHSARLALLIGTATVDLWPSIWATPIRGLVAMPCGMWVFRLTGGMRSEPENCIVGAE